MVREEKDLNRQQQLQGEGLHQQLGDVFLV
jgi:hypothetical protein